MRMSVLAQCGRCGGVEVALILSFSSTRTPGLSGVRSRLSGLVQLLLKGAGEMETGGIFKEKMGCCFSITGNGLQRWMSTAANTDETLITSILK